MKTPHPLLFPMLIIGLALIPGVRAAGVDAFDAVVAANLDKYVQAVAFGFSCL